ncbi:hypothetical protein COO60DRAFT_915495 [Scenedesmus sp. NREL 46B-D3]|nr:hypothetical protein COO60DRAFT_915495 [Scenedesmus sp. NREL 46B-D3]
MAACTQGCVCPPSMQQVQLTQQGCSLESDHTGWPAVDNDTAECWQALDGPVLLDPTQQHCVTSAEEHQQQRGKQPSWLMPWQTGNRQAGRQVAVAIKSKRTPIGGFAQHDLAKAPK